METSSSKVYSSFTTHLSCPSLSYCRFWKEWKEIQDSLTSVSVLSRLLPRFLNPFSFTPSVYHFFKPYHDPDHLSPKKPLNYLRVAHCFFFEQYWFWFFFSPSNKSQPTQILLLLSALFLPLALLPVFLLLLLTQTGFLPSGLLCYSFPWVPPRVTWPDPLLLAVSHAVICPLSIWSTLVLLHKSPYQEKTKEDACLKVAALFVTVLMVQFILSSWGIDMLGFAVRFFILLLGMIPLVQALTRPGPVSHARLLISGMVFIGWMLLADLEVLASLFFIFFLPVWFSLLPQRRKRTTAEWDFMAEYENMRWHNLNACGASLYLIFTLPPAYAVIFYYALWGVM